MSGRADSREKQQRGAVLLPSLLAMGVLLGVGALAVDLGMLLVARSELQTASEAAALAGVKELPFGWADDAVARAVEYAGRNRVLGSPVELVGREDVEFGTWDYVSRQFDADSGTPNAVRVRARRSEERGNPVSTWFAAMLGIDELSVGASAVAVALNRDVVVVIDRSGSMGDDPRCGTVPAMIGPVREAAADFLTTLSHSVLPDRAALVTFCVSAQIESEIVDLDAHLNGLVTTVLGIEAARCGSGGGTNTGQAIETAIELFELDQQQGGNPLGFGQRFVILLSDGLANRGAHGEDTYGHESDPNNAAWQYVREAAQAAAAAGLTIHTVSLGLAGQQYQQMLEIANLTGGRCLEAATPEVLDEIFAQLATAVEVALVN